MLDLSNTPRATGPVPPGPPGQPPPGPELPPDPGGGPDQPLPIREPPPPIPPAPTEEPNEPVRHVGEAARTRSGPEAGAP